MSDSHRRYNAIKKGLMQCLGSQPQGHFQQHLHTLALLIAGIIGSSHTQLPEVAAHSPEKTKLESRAKKFKRWLSNERVSEELYWLPFARALLGKLSQHKNEITLVIDGSVMGQGCVGLLVGVVYAGRALPVAWLVREGKKGHFSQAEHLALLAKVRVGP